MIIFVALRERDSMETVNQLEVVLGEIDAMSTGTTHKICYKSFIQPVSPDIIRGSASFSKRTITLFKISHLWLKI